MTPDPAYGSFFHVAGSAEEAAHLAVLREKFGDEMVDQLLRGRSATWPECPQHPNSHPLEPVAADQHTAVWRCPRSGAVICAIGDLR